MTIIYCAKDKRSKAEKQLDLGENYIFASPTDQAVDHSATRVVVVGDHPSIAERYGGIAKVEQVTLKTKSTESEND